GRAAGPGGRQAAARCLLPRPLGGRHRARLACGPGGGTGRGHPRRRRGLALADPAADGGAFAAQQGHHAGTGTAGAGAAAAPRARLVAAGAARVRDRRGRGADGAERPRLRAALEPQGPPRGQGGTTHMTDTQKWQLLALTVLLGLLLWLLA